MLSFFALMYAFVASGDLMEYQGRPVVRVHVDAPAGEDVTSLRSLISIKPGYLLAATDVQASLKRIYSLGRFASVEVYGEPIADAVELNFRLIYAQRLKTLEIEGLEHTEEEALRGALQLSVGDEVDRRTAGLVRQRALAYLQDGGFPEANATVIVKTESDQGDTDILLRVQEGPPLVVRTVEFHGNPRIPRPLLQNMVRTRPGKTFDRRILKTDVEHLRREYLDHDFLMVEVEEPEIATVERSVVVRFFIHAGDRIARIVRGNQSISDEELLALWPSPDLPMTPETPRSFARRIQTHYERFGRIGTTVRARAFRTDQGVRYYVFEVDEAERTFVRAIAFRGVTIFDEDLLREQIEATLDGELQEDSLFAPIPKGASRAAFREPYEGDPPVPPRQRWIPSLYEDALDDISNAYRDRGYLSARVGPPILNAQSRRNARVEIPVEEGVQTLIHSLSFRANAAVEAGEMLEALAEEKEKEKDKEDRPAVSPGSPYSPNAVEDARIALIRLYRDRGYLYARVFADTSFSPDRDNVDIAFRFEEGPQVILQTVLVRGNQYTQEGVIRSRINLKTGAPYRLDQALQDQRDIASLGTFSSVRVKLIDEETPGELKDLVAEVSELPRQQVDLSVGLSTADGPRVRASYGHINLFGTASTFTASAKVNRKILFGVLKDALAERYRDFTFFEELEHQVRAGIRSPRVLALPLEPSFRFDLVEERENAIPYTLLSLTGIFGADLRLTEHLHLAVEPQASITGLLCAQVDDEQDDEGGCLGAVERRRPGQRPISRGIKRTLKVGPTLTWDRRDYPINPTSGFIFSLKGLYGLGSTLGEDVSRQTGLDILRGSGDWQAFSFVRAEGSVTGYIPLSKLVLALSARAGFIRVLTEPPAGEFPSAPIDERFYLGGRDTLRGFTERALVPEDVQVPRDTELFVSQGGHSYVLLKSELRIPIAGALSTGLFIDMGNLWFEYPDPKNLNLRFGAGFGLRYATPAGALALDFGFNPEPRPRRGERIFEPHFSVGLF